MLGVKPGASEEEIKRAYRQQAKKWHPDQYLHTPQHDVAVEKMKEINAAYDALTGKNTGTGGPNPNGPGYGYGYSAGSQGAEFSQKQRARMFIQSHRYKEAEEILSKLTERDAEWHFLISCVYAASGRYDSARVHLQQAVEMDPNNPEYRMNWQRFSSQGNNYRKWTMGTQGANPFCQMGPGSAGQNDAMCRVPQCMMFASLCRGGAGLGCFPYLFCC
ncbi:MAG: DnaJ domain-containing protein [Clostridia bacterium]|nr:DnaJ domain-containing protein [Clostridia bacterium]